ncbi:MAG TPA: hypothetical protein VIQ60_14120 [Gemmatimonadaceae bacterium]
MSPKLARRGSTIRVGVTAAVLAVLLACQDQSLIGVSGPVPPPSADFGAEAIMGTVDAATGAVSFEPMGSAMSLAPGISAAIYGDQDVTVRLYSSPLEIDSTSQPGTKTWSFRVGVRNYLDFPIGSNQGGGQSDDTLGVYVAIVAPPTVTSTSGTCSTIDCRMTLTNADGVGSFTGPGQSYFYWPERLAAKQLVAGADTTSTRRLWKFTGPAVITGFSFVVMVKAAWPQPYERSWNVFYDAAADSLPDATAEPLWKRLTTTLGAGAGTESWSTKGLTLTAGTDQSLYMYRSDSLAPAEAAYIEARLMLNKNAPQTQPENVFGLQDAGHLAAIGVMNDSVGFVVLKPFLPPPPASLGYRWEFVGAKYDMRNNDAKRLHTYRLRKFGSDSVTLELDGARVLGMSGSAVPLTSPLLPGITAFFGVSGMSGPANTTWSHVTYNLGTTQP